jgi:hypothetical protein
VINRITTAAIVAPVNAVQAGSLLSSTILAS